jgi:hypothetical protein
LDNNIGFKENARFFDQNFVQIHNIDRWDVLVFKKILLVITLLLNQNIKTGKIYQITATYIPIPSYHKIYQMTVKMPTLSNAKPSKNTQIDIYGMQICHLATPLPSPAPARQPV